MEGILDLSFLFSYPQYFTVSPKSPMRGGNRPWFPMELLMVCDMQRVKKEQESVQNQAVMIRVGYFICNPHVKWVHLQCSAALPEKRFNQTAAMKKEVGLVPGNKMLLNAGIKPDDKFTMVRLLKMDTKITSLPPGLQKTRIAFNRALILRTDLCRWEWYISLSLTLSLDYKS